MNYSKEKIKDKLLNNDLSGINEIILKYEENNKYDIDLYSMKGIYFYLIGEFENAKKVLLEGLKKIKFNFDLNYNLAMVFYANSEYKESMKYYLISLYLTNDSNIKKSIKEILEVVITNNLISTLEKEDVLKYIDYNFNGETMSFPGLNEKNMLAREIDLFNKKYFFGVYDKFSKERDGIYLENHLKWAPHLMKTEILEIKKGKYKKINEDGILPILALEENTEIIIDEENKEYKLKYNIPNRFYYYNLKKGSKIKSNKNIAIGNLIPNKRNFKKKKLVLNIFVDGLSQSFLSEKGFEKLMPNTYKFFKKGTICNNTYVSGEWTYVNLASFFTGKYTTNHGIFHPSYNSTISEESKILSEYFKENGYYTAKIDGDWRSLPVSGYIRGIDRYLYQSAMRGMNVEEVISESIEHIDAFKELNNFMWICISDLHDVADEYEGSLSVQTKLSLENRIIENKSSESSVRKSFDKNKEIKYAYQIKKVDMYMASIFEYIENNYNNEEIVISLVADHGQGYLVKEEDEFLSDMRTNVAMMFRGSDFKAIECEELIQGLDLMPILLNSCGIDFQCEGLDCNLPKCFGGEREREYIYTESIFPKSTYKASIKTKNEDVYIESFLECEEDGRVSLDKYKIKSVNKATRECIENIDENKCIDIVKKHLNYYLKINE